VELRIVIGDRYEENWQSWRCSDCDPEFVEGYGTKPYVMLVPEGEEVPEHCPRCGSHLSLCDGDKGLRITNTPAERWAAKR
jgi:Zn finger protein HypA/HybF involved in hydrogenase expression